jgi:hypothetical protein
VFKVWADLNLGLKQACAWRVWDLILLAEARVTPNFASIKESGSELKVARPRWTAPSGLYATEAQFSLTACEA